MNEQNARQSRADRFASLAIVVSVVCVVGRTGGAQPSCEPQTTEILTFAQRAQFRLSYSDSWSKLSSRSGARDGNSAVLADSSARVLREWGSFVTSPLPNDSASGSRPLSLHFVNGDLYLTGLLIWKRVPSGWQVVAGVRSHGDVLGRMGDWQGRVTVCVDNSVFTHLNGNWVNVLGINGPPIIPVSNLPGRCTSFAELSSTLYATAATAPSAAFPSYPTTAPCLWKKDGTQWIDAAPGLTGYASDMLAFQDGLIITGVMNAPDLSPPLQALVVRYAAGQITTLVSSLAPGRIVTDSPSLTRSHDGTRLFISGLPNTDQNLPPLAPLAYDGSNIIPAFPGLTSAQAIWSVPGGEAALAPVPVPSPTFGSPLWTFFQFGIPAAPLIDFDIRDQRNVSPVRECLFSFELIQPLESGDAVVAWTHNGNPITPGTTPSGSTITISVRPDPRALGGHRAYRLTVANPRRLDQGIYACTVTTPCGEAISREALLTVCFADFDGSGAVSVNDVFEYLSRWFAASTSADIDDTQGVSQSDLLQFVDSWFAGCI